MDKIIADIQTLVLTDQSFAGSRCRVVVKEGIRTTSDIQSFLGAALIDLRNGAISATAANKVSSLVGKLLRSLEFAHGIGRSAEQRQGKSSVQGLATDRRV